MNEEHTCGRGLAARSTLQTTLGNLINAIGDVLDHHTTSLDLGDESGREEDRAYRSLVERHRAAGELLVSLGSEMASYRDLPMAAHDTEVLSSERAVEIFARAVAAERELASLLAERLEEDEAMLGQMREA